MQCHVLCALSNPWYMFVRLAKHTNVPLPLYTLYYTSLYTGNELFLSFEAPAHRITLCYSSTVSALTVSHLVTPFQTDNHMQSCSRRTTFVFKTQCVPIMLQV